MPHERGDISPITNGNRLSTYTLSGPRGRGVIGIDGAAHLVRPGDLVIVALEPRVVLAAEAQPATGLSVNAPQPLTDL